MELTRGYLLDHDEEKYAQKCERVYTFIKVPKELEKVSKNCMPIVINDDLVVVV